VGGNGATETVCSGGSGNPGAHIVRGALIDYTFTTPKAELSRVGGEPAIAEANAIPLERTGGICPKTATWSGKYEITSPSALRVFGE
jgi:hypothetical protein